MGHFVFLKNRPTIRDTERSENLPDVTKTAPNGAMTHTLRQTNHWNPQKMGWSCYVWRITTATIANKMNKTKSKHNTKQKNIQHMNHNITHINPKTVIKGGADANGIKPTPPHYVKSLEFAIRDSNHKSQSNRAIWNIYSCFFFHDVRATWTHADAKT